MKIPFGSVLPMRATALVSLGAAAGAAGLEAGLAGVEADGDDAAEELLLEAADADLEEGAAGLAALVVAGLEEAEGRGEALGGMMQPETGMVVQRP